MKGVHILQISMTLSINTNETHKQLKKQNTAFTYTNKPFPTKALLHRHDNSIHKKIRFKCTSEGCNSEFKEKII